MERPTIFLINLVIVVALAFVLAYRERAKGRRGWPSASVLSAMAVVSAVLLLLIAVFVYRTSPEPLPSSLEELTKQQAEELERLKNWQPDAASAAILSEYNPLIDVRVTPAEAPQQYSLRFVPEPDQHYRYVTVTNMYSNIEGLEEQKRANPMIEDHYVAITRNGAGELLITTECKRFWMLAPGADEGREMPVANINSQMVVRNGELYRVRGNESVPSVEPTPILGGDRDRVAFYLPKYGTPKIGQSWSSEMKTESFESRAKHTLVGFATVEGLLTAKIVSKGEARVRSAEINKQAAEAAEEGAEIQSDLESKGMQDVPALSTSPPTLQTKVVTYVELATGLIIRAETEVIAGKDNPPLERKTKTVSVTQRVAS